MPKFLLLGIVLCLLQTADGQRVSLKGTVIDSATGKSLASATVSLATLADTSLLTFGLADSTGSFRSVMGGGGPFLLSISYAGYEPVWRTLRQLPTVGEFELGRIALVPYGLLPAARVSGRRPPVEISNDTIEFNAENFKTQPNAVVEDMLRKIPGVTVESDGTVKVNGQTVRRVLVNGKEFFTGDVKMATKNLNADAVDKLQVFDRKSDQAQFTGVDDGNSEKTINIQLKKDRNFATFGKVAAGGGTDTRYDAQCNLNRFRGDEQLSFLGMANNTNRQGFSLMDALNFSGALARGMRNGGGGISIRTGDAGDNNGLPVTGLGQSQQGIARTIAGGVNVNNTWDKGRTSLNGHFTTSDIRLVTDRQSLIQNLGDSVYTTFDTARSTTRISQQRLGMTLDRAFDSSFSLRLTPTLTWQQNRIAQTGGYSSVTGAGSPLNAGNNRTGAAPGAFNLVSDLLLRKRLARKGRTLSLDLNMNYNHSGDEGDQVSDNTFSVINQRYSRDAVMRSAGGNLTYTEPVGRRSLIALSGYYNINTGNTDKSASDFNVVSGKYDLPDTVLSNHFASDYRYGGGGVSF